MRKQRRILFFLYEGFEILDMAGPASVFANAGAMLGGGAYRCSYVSADGGMIAASAGISMNTVAIKNARIGDADTMLIVGADEKFLIDALMNAPLIDKCRAAARRAGRVGSICSGAFLLAETGVLNGGSATTHWSARSQFAERYPQVRITDDALYIQNDRVWTSAGVTTGIDMALAMVRADYGNDVMRAVAQQLVVYAHRPGNQSQFSPVLKAQTSGEGDFASLITWMERKLGDGITVPDLAHRANMSERTFHRKFVKAVGVPPSKFLDQLRLQRAKELLESGAPVKTATYAVGFKSESGFRTAFEKKYGVSPSTLRAMQPPSC